MDDVSGISVSTTFSAMRAFAHTLLICPHSGRRGMRAGTLCSAR